MSRDSCHRASREHHQRFLQSIKALLEQHAGQFPPSSTTGGIFSCDTRGPDGPRGQLQHIVQQVQTGLAAMGYSMIPAFYETIDATRVISPKGELVAIWRNGVAELYREREKLWPSVTFSSSSTQHQAGPALSKDNEEGEEGNDVGNNNEKTARAKTIQLRIQQAKNRRDQLQASIL